MPPKRNKQTKRKSRLSKEAVVTSLVRNLTTTTATAVHQIVTTDVSTVAFSTAAQTRIFCTSDPTSDAEFADIAALYQEYRTRAIQLEYVPTIQNGLPDAIGLTAVSGGGWLSVENHGASVASTLTVAGADEYADTLALHSLDSRFKRSMVAVGPGEMEWTNTSVSPAFPFEVVAVTDFTQTATAEASLARIVKRLVIELRGRH